MRGSRKYVGVVTPRDEAVFRFLFESKVATAKQIRSHLFPKTSYQTTARRLAQFTRSHLLAQSSIRFGRTFQCVYGLTDEAYDKYVRDEEVNDRRRQLKSEKINHDLALVDIRNRFMRFSGVKHYYSENALHSRFDLAGSPEFKEFLDLGSDAVVEIVRDEKNRFLVPLEYEATLKSKERCHEKLFDYYIKHDGSAVLFICADALVLNRMQNTDREICKEFKPKMYFALLSDVLNESEKVSFITSNHEKRIVLSISSSG